MLLHLRFTSAHRDLRNLLAGVVCALLLVSSEAGAQVVSGSLVIEPVPAGAVKSDTVTFDLPGKLIVNGEPSKPANKQLVGSHTCAFDPASSANAATDGHYRFYLRLNRGKKLGTVFQGQLTAGVGTLLFEAGCDADSATEDAFQGDPTALFAEMAVYAAQMLSAAEYGGDGSTVDEEIRASFGIESSHRLRKVKLIEQHDLDTGSRGGSATGHMSAKVKLVYRP